MGILMMLLFDHTTLSVVIVYLCLFQSWFLAPSLAERFFPIMLKDQWLSVCQHCVYLSLAVALLVWERWVTHKGFWFSLGKWNTVIGARDGYMTLTISFSLERKRTHCTHYTHKPHGSSHYSHIHLSLSLLFSFSFLIRFWKLKLELNAFLSECITIF